MLSIQLNIPGLESYCQPLLQQLLTKPCHQWLYEELSVLSSDDLTTLCKKFKIYGGGRKLAKITRLLQNSIALKVLSAWSESLVESALVISEFFKRKKLKSLCEKLGLITGSGAFSMASSLVDWRESSNERGDRFIKEFLILGE